MILQQSLDNTKMAYLFARTHGNLVIKNIWLLTIVMDVE